MAGIAIITEACIDTKDRACVDVCPVQCIYEFVPVKNMLVSEQAAGSGIVENSQAPNEAAIAIFGDTTLYVNLDECTSCTACYQPGVCPVGAIYSEEHVPNGSSHVKYNSDDPNKGHDHTFFSTVATYSPTDVARVERAESHFYQSSSHRVEVTMRPVASCAVGSLLYRSPA